MTAVRAAARNHRCGEAPERLRFRLVVERYDPQDRRIKVTEDKEFRSFTLAQRAAATFFLQPQARHTRILISAVRPVSAK